MAERFLRFCTEKFKLLMMAARISDARKKPEIPMATIVLLMVMSLAAGRRSMSQIDVFARRRCVRRLLGTRPDRTTSDTTLQRVVPTIKLDEAREELQKAYIERRQRGASFTLESGRKIRAGVTDGYETGSGMASCLLVFTDRGVSFVDAEPYEKDGKELPSSTALVKRAACRHGTGFLDLVLGDPLYVSAPFWNECRKNGLHVLVKGDDPKKEDLLILKDAHALCAAGEGTDRVEYAEGVDAARGVSFRVRAVRGLHHDGYKYGTVKVALVEETRLKPRRGKQAKRPNVSSFWVIVTDERLTPEEMRELGHLRWTIENLGFRALNAHLASKRTWTRGEMKDKTFPILLLLMFLAFNIVNEFQAKLDADDVRRALELGAKSAVHSITLQLVAELVIESLADVEPLAENA